jgi:hypothetical protein
LESRAGAERQGENAARPQLADFFSSAHTALDVVRHAYLRLWKKAFLTFLDISMILEV